MPTELVSIIMPAYNGGQYLGQAIASVQQQSYGDWELLIVNDGSTDNTEQQVTEFAYRDQRIKLINNASNLGLVASLNKGLSASMGKLVARLDSDDYWSNPRKLAEQVEFMQTHLDYGLVGTNGVAIDQVGNRLFPMAFPSSDEAIRKQLLFHNCFIHSSVMFRSSLVEELGKYKATFVQLEDYELWLKMGQHSKFYVLPETMVCYRINYSGLTQTHTLQFFNAFISLSHQFRHSYPNYLAASIKLHLQKWFLQLFGTRWFNKVKSVLLGN